RLKEKISSILYYFWTPYSKVTNPSLIYMQKKPFLSLFRLLLAANTFSQTPVLVKDICPGGSSMDIYNSGLTELSGTAYFSATDGANGYELWKTDGTTGGTQMLKDIWAGSGGSVPRNLTLLNGHLYFSAFDAANGQELWGTDGTNAGTF